MTGKTHAAVGLGTVLAVTQPSTVSGLVLAAGTGMLGALISDIDVGTSKSHKDADRITLIAVLLVAAEIALNYFCNFSIWEKIRNDKSVAPVAMGVIIFIAVCAFGKNQPHRSFMHSLAAGVIFTMVTYTMFSKQAALAFMIAFMTHILLDLPNCKGIQLFWPIPGHHCFKLCASNGWVNRILCLAGTVMAINLFAGFAGISIFNWIIKK